MSRAPADLLPAGHLSGRDAIWTHIRRLKTFTSDDLEVATGFTKSRINDYLTGLRKAGYIKRHERVQSTSMLAMKNQYAPYRYELIKDIGIDAPRVRKDGTDVSQGLGREQMWRTMKVLGEFDYRDLALHASTDACAIKESDARDYIKYMAKARYIVATGREQGKLIRYRFIPSRNTGPKAPMVQRVKRVYDPNTGKVVYPREGEA